MSPCYSEALNPNIMGNESVHCSSIFLILHGSTSSQPPKGQFVELVTSPEFTFHFSGFLKTNAINIDAK